MQRVIWHELIMEDRWLSVDEIAQYLGVQPDTIYKWVSRKHMPAHKLGRLLKFKTFEVDEWIRSGGAADKTDKSDSEQ